MLLSDLYEDAWHASPHTFDKFRTNAASGEGGQSFAPQYKDYFQQARALNK